MAPLLKSLLGNGGNDRQLTEEMRGILREMQEERTRYETLLERGDAQANRLKLLGEPIAKAEYDVKGLVARLKEVEDQLEIVPKLSGQLESVDGRAKDLAKEQGEAETRILKALEEADGIRGAFGEIREKIELAVSIQNRLDSFLEVDRPLTVLESKAGEIRTAVDGTSDQLTKLREQHERLLDAHKLALTKMEALDRRREEFSRNLTDKERRIGAAEESLRAMDGVRGTVDDVKREIGALKALGDSVAQKTAGLEAQRDTVDRALARAEELDRAMRQVDAGLRQQQDHLRTLNALREEIASLQALHETVEGRSREISQLQHDVNEQTATARQDLTSVREEMKHTLERFDFESRGLESVSQRVVDLRGELVDFENRFRALTEASQSVNALTSRTEAIGQRLESLTGELARVDDEMVRVRAMRRDLEASQQAARELGAQVTRLEESRAAVESALKDVSRLAEAHAGVRDAMEQVKLAHDAIGAARESQAETRAWLTSTAQTLATVGAQAAEVQKLAPRVEEVEARAKRVDESLAAIETRSTFADDLHRRLAELGSQSSQLNERGQQLLARMEAAEQRFVSLGSHAADAERVANTIAGVVSSVTDSSQKLDGLVKSVHEVTARCASVETLAERTQAMKQELDQRQAALEEAATRLQQASKLRKETASAVQQLEQTAGQLTAAIGTVNQKLAEAGELSAGIESRTDRLTAVQKRLDEFEARLARWERVDHDVNRSLEQMAARQGTVEVLRTDLDRMFSIAEQTASDVRSITGSHTEIEESRALLDDVRRRLDEVRVSESTLEERKRQMAKAEERIARAEALLADVRSSLEALESQKALVEHAVERTGSLQYLLKQAEGVMEGLREEQRMSSRVRSAVALVRDEDSDDDADEEPRAKAA